MLKKIIAGMLAAVLTIMLSGCSEYEMTVEDLAIQKSLQGFWSADPSTGYNSYDSEGNPTELLVVEFTGDFRYFIHECDFENSMVMTYEPISYSIEDELFRVDVDGVASYAKASVSADGTVLSWITSERTEKYNRLDEEAARAFGIPEYNGGNDGDDNSGTDSDNPAE